MILGFATRGLKTAYRSLDASAVLLPRKCLGYPPFLGYIYWPKVVGALLLLSAPLPYFTSGVPVDM